MTLPPDFRITTAMLWQGALIFALLDLGFVPLLAWRITAVKFRRLRWTLVGTTGLFWGVLWAWVLEYFWESVYSYIFLGWMRGLIPFAYGVLFAGVGLVLWWLSSHLPGPPVLSFCLLGGLWGMITHVWAVYLGIVDKPPLLQGAARGAAVVIAAFEFTFYWCVILSLAAVLQQSWQWLRRETQRRV
jgi:hypothetical protein